MLDLKACIFCNGEKNPQLGDLVSSDEFSVHTLCLFSASELGQHGSSDKDGILGFWIEDIKQALENSQENRCEYCQQIGATVFCAECQVFSSSLDICLKFICLKLIVFMTIAAN